jgi:hypothetical protein
MSEQGERLATELAARIADLDATLAPLSARQWSLVAAEGWPLGFVAHHITLGLARQRRWIERRLRSGSVHEFSWDTTNAMNAALARRIGVPSKDVVRDCLRGRGEAMVTLARALTEGQLNVMAFSLGEHQRSVEWVIRRVALRHIDDHVASIRAALAASASG